MRSAVEKYCEMVGSDPMLVQGAGGNISWKDGGILWIKASGRWLADAGTKDIFVPVDLSHLQKEVGLRNFDVAPISIGESQLRPSIETLLHSLMPQKIVVHLHAIEILAHLIRDGFKRDFGLKSDSFSNINWASVDYYKPGAALASAINAALLKGNDINVVFLQNHGVVIGGASIDEVDYILQTLLEVMNNSVLQVSDVSPPVSDIVVGDDVRFTPVGDVDVHQLATNTSLFNRLETDWALYPDHVVFLGAKAHRFNSLESFDSEMSSMAEMPELVFIQGIGVFTRAKLGVAKQAQLRCYYDVVSRLPHDVKVNVLVNESIAELLNWDAEQYRMNIAK